MRAGILLVVFLRAHEYPGLAGQVQLAQLRVVVQPLPLVLEVVVGEEACVDMLREEFSQLEDHLVLDHLELDLSLVQVDYHYVHQSRAIGDLLLQEGLFYTTGMRGTGVLTRGEACGRLLLALHIK